ncbi:flagellar biosynthesis protein FlhF [Pleionea sp. CnH1-48]|uniref:flagellar biosynthesis protein FlhF n=1 Tax=Pleionea sp. CnH1-48 TaxID=2954494 RepID=UPI002097A556|nr:flagellar biosynthesis protein FlhF [Pleionea sp. CnH1-48]MCO7226100.1 flagellar biosynthesis protein FlhF [Pleionea sp. CnH1-48]
MKIKRVVAKDMRTALTLVSEELGADAAILSTTKVKGGVELVAAMDYDETLLHKREQPAEEEGSPELAPEVAEPAAVAKTMPAQQPANNPEPPSFRQQLESLSADELAQTERSILSRAHARIAVQQNPFTDVTEMPKARKERFKAPSINDALNPNSLATAGLSALQQEILQMEQQESAAAKPPEPALRRSIQSMMKPDTSQAVIEDISDSHPAVKKVLNQQQKKVSRPRQSAHSEPKVEPAQQQEPAQHQEPAIAAMREELAMLRQLLEQQLSEPNQSHLATSSSLTTRLANEMKAHGLSAMLIKQLTEVCGKEPDFERACKKAMHWLSKTLTVTDDDILTHGGMVALVGPSGVGKTTSVAKLAARYVLQNGSQSVGLISTDSYRIAAHEQLKTYGRILRLPVRVARDADTLKEALNAFRDKRLVLIDTAGMSHHDERMAQQMSCFNHEEFPIRNYLVLSATAQTGVLQESIKLFSKFHISGCLLTKLDEATSLGEPISTLIQHDLPLAYTTDGQRVPEDIRVARSRHLVSKMMWLAKQQKQDETRSIDLLATGTH